MLADHACDTEPAHTSYSSFAIFQSTKINEGGIARPLLESRVADLCKCGCHLFYGNLECVGCLGER